jgi:hypothetical protein
MTVIEQGLHVVWQVVGPRMLRGRVEQGDERGDVPGWVLVTIMTAGLVAALWAVAGDTLVDVFRTAIADTVGGP